MISTQWTLYDIENQVNPVLYYVVLRDDNNTGNFQPISSTIPGSNSTFTDINWSTYPNASYRVEVIWSINCVPARLDNTGNFMSGSVSMSNIKNAQGPLNTNTYTPEYNWSVFPNPATDNIIVKTTTEGNKTVVLRDASGRLVRSWNVNGTQAQLSLEGIAYGVYFLSIDGEANAVKKVIKE